MKKRTNIIYSQEEINKIKRAALVASRVLDLIAPHVTSGITTQHLNDLCHGYIEQQGAISASLNYQGFPKSVCTSVNEEVCHGVPGSRVLKSGDIINIDVGVILDGWYGDTSRMYMIEPVLQERRDLVVRTKQALETAIKAVRVGCPLNIIGNTIEEFIAPFGYGIVRNFCGHGVGQQFHHDPKILHYANSITTPTISPGMCFTIEPMINLGKHETKTLDDRWTVVTADGSVSAQWEHMIVINHDNTREVLTTF